MQMKHIKLLFHNYIILQGDIDGDGFLDYGEFVAISVHLRKMGNDDHLRKAFAFFDRNESGYIEIEELRDALADELDSNSEEVIISIIQDVDTDKVIFLLLLCLFPLLYRQYYFPLRLSSLLQFSLFYEPKFACFCPTFANVPGWSDKL